MFSRREKIVTSLEFGKSRNWLITMETKAPEKYKFFSSFDNDSLHKSIELACLDLEKVQAELDELIKTDEKLVEFVSKQTYNMKNDRQAYPQFLTLVYRVDVLGFKYEAIKKLKDVLRQIKKIKGKK